MTKVKFLGSLALNAIMLGTVTSASCESDKPAKNEINGKQAVTMDAFLKKLKDGKVMLKGEEFTADNLKSLVSKFEEKDLKEATETEKKDISKCIVVDGKTYVEKALLEAIKKKSEETAA